MSEKSVDGGYCAGKLALETDYRPAGGRKVPWSPMRRQKKKSRSRSSTGLKDVNMCIQNSSSQPTLNSIVEKEFVKLMITTSHAPSIEKTIDKKQPKSEIFIQNDIVLSVDGSVLSGSIDSIIKRLIPTKDFYPHSNYIFSILVNIRTIISPEEVMQRVVQHCMFSMNSDSGNFWKENRLRLFNHIFHLCSEWTRNIPYDFRNNNMRTRLSELLGLCSVDKTIKQKAEDLENELKHNLNRFDCYWSAILSLHKSIEENSEKRTPIDQLNGLIVLGPDAKIVAQQLTLIELERFSMVGVDEIITTISLNDISELGRNNSSSISSISFYVEWFNRLSSYIATQVLCHQKKKHRVSVIEYLIDIAKECCELGNFNSLMAIVAGLSLPSVARLKKTWSRVDKTKLDILQHLLDPSANFLSYRATMKAAVWRAESAKKQEQKIIIPFFVLLLKDLYLLFHNSNRILPNGHVNFVAFAQVSDQLYNVLQWKNTKCCYAKNGQILQNLLTSPVFGDKDGLLVSFDIESADSAIEKEQYKNLKNNQ